MRPSASTDRPHSAARWLDVDQGALRRFEQRGEDTVRWGRRRARPAGTLLVTAERLAAPIEPAEAEAADDRFAEIDASPTTRRRATAQEAADRVTLDRPTVRAAPDRH